MAEQISKISTGDPEWTRLPKRSASEPISGLSRQVVCRLIKDGQVRSIAFVGPGRRRGARVFSLKDLRMHMEQLGKEQGLTSADSAKPPAESSNNFAPENQGPQTTQE